MTKFTLYYGVKRDTGDLETIALKDRGQLGPLKEQCKKDLSDKGMCKKYSYLVIASDYGLEKRFKTPEVIEEPEAPKPKRGRKPKSED